MEYFSVQFFGECWSGLHAGTTYARDGESRNGCWSGVGKEYNNFVYKLTNKQGIINKAKRFRMCSKCFQFKTMIRECQKDACLFRDESMNDFRVLTNIVFCYCYYCSFLFCCYCET